MGSRGAGTPGVAQGPKHVQLTTCATYDARNRSRPDVACRPHSYTLRNRVSDMRVTCVDTTLSPPASPSLVEATISRPNPFDVFQSPAESLTASDPAISKSTLDHPFQLNGTVSCAYVTDAKKRSNVIVKSQSQPCRHREVFRQNHTRYLTESWEKAASDRKPAGPESTVPATRGAAQADPQRTTEAADRDKDPGQDLSEPPIVCRTVNHAWRETFRGLFSAPHGHKIGGMSGLEPGPSGSECNYGREHANTKTISAALSPVAAHLSVCRPPGQVFCVRIPGHKIGGMSGLEPGTSRFRVEHSAATPHDPTTLYPLAANIKSPCSTQSDWRLTFIIVDVPCWLFDSGVLLRTSRGGMDQHSGRYNPALDGHRAVESVYSERAPGSQKVGPSGADRSSGFQECGHRRGSEKCLWTFRMPVDKMPSLLNTTLLYPNTTAADPGLLYSDLIREFQVNIPASSTVGDLVVDMATLQTSNATNVTYVLMCCTYDVFTLLTDGRVMVTSELDFNIQYSIPVAELDSFGAILAGYVIHVNLTSNVTLYKDPDGLCNTTSFYVTMEENSDGPPAGRTCESRCCCRLSGCSLSSPPLFICYLFPGFFPFLRSLSGRCSPGTSVGGHTFPFFYWDASCIELAWVNAKTVKIKPPRTLQDLQYLFSAATADLGSLVNQTSPPVQFSLVPGGDAARFSIDPSSGVLTNNAWLDREETDALVFRVALATRYDVTFATVTVAVTDVNDNPPVVVENWSSEYILQSTPINSIVGLVRGEDPDVGENATLTYTIEPEAGEDFSELFFINNVTGVITVISNFKFIREHIPLKVRVVDNGEPPRHVNTIVELSLLSNDAVGNLTRFEVSVPEDVPIGTALLNATVPASAGDGTVSYTYTMQDPSGINQKYFHVHNETGEVTLISGLDRETEPSHEFFVEPTAESGCDRQGLILVVIILEDINDNDPVFDHVTLRGTVRENTPMGELVTIIPELSVADQDFGIHGSVDIRLTGEGSDLFTVNSTTGQIYVSGNLDYETAQSYRLTVEARDMDGMPGYRSATARLTIVLQDENDNPPQFSQDDFHFSIPENSADSALVGTLLATDRDSEHNGKVDHFIADGGDGLFRLDFSSGQLALVRGDLLDRETQDQYTLTVRAQSTEEDQSDWSKVLEPISTTENLPAGTRLFSLTVTDPDAGASGSVHNNRFSVVMLDSSTQHWAIVNDLPLDREERDTYELGITATDMGTPALSSSVTILLSVGDVNDVPPTFLEPPDVVTLLGGSRPGTLVAIFAVEDPDVSGDIEYSIAMDRDRLFRIGDDGVVVLKRASKGDFNIVSSLPHAMAMDTNVTVAVTDGSHVHVEDGSSLSTLQFHSEQYDFDIDENSAPDTVIGTVDVSSDQPVRYSLQSAGTGHNFSIDSSTGMIRTQLQLDREVKDNHYMIVVATESSAGQFSFPRKAYAVVSVQVLDVNDNPPQFDRQSYAADVAEDAPAGLIILNVSASDPDAGQNAHVVFSKLNGNITSDSKRLQEKCGFTCDLVSDGRFAVDPGTGAVRVNGSLDREAADSHLIVLQATDGGNLFSTATVSIRVGDVNDNVPIFARQYYNISVPENSDNKLVLSVVATDDDIGTNGQVRYSLIGADNFTIGERTGDIASTFTFDRESVSRYRFTVRAEDRGDPPHSSSAEVTVMVTDENDNLPVFLGTPYRKKVPEDTPLLDSVFTVTATDADSGENGDVEFGEQPGGVCGGLFFVNATTGVMTTRQPLFSINQTEREHCVAVVTAYDRGPDRKHTSVEVVFNITDSNRHDPVFVKSRLSDRFSEAWSVERRELFTVTATDADLGVNGEVDYSIVDDYGSVGVTPPYMVGKSCKVPFPRAQRRATLGIEPGASGSESNALTVGPRRHGFFTVDQSGKVWANRSLDREEQDFYNLTVEATDRAVINPRTATATLEVWIDDVNDNAPKFVRDNVTAEIRLLPVGLDQTSPPGAALVRQLKTTANTSVGTHVTRLFSTDADVGTNAVPLYRIQGVDVLDARLSTPDGLLTVNNQTGDVNTSSALNFTDAKEDYVISVRVIVEDALNSGLQDDLAFRIVVPYISSNRHSPRFPQVSYTVNRTRENLMGGSEPFIHLITVSAEDSDSGTDGEVEYSILNSDDTWFDLLGDLWIGEGRVFLEVNPNGTVLTGVDAYLHRLVIQAEDKGHPARTGTTDVLLHILPAATPSSPPTTAVPDCSPVYSSGEVIAISCVAAVAIMLTFATSILYMRTRLELKKMKEYDKPDVHQYEVIPAPKSPATKPPVPLPPVPMPPVEHIELQEIELVEPVEEPAVAQRDTGGRRMPNRRVLDRRNVPRGTNGGPAVRAGHSPRIPSKVAPVKEPLPSLGLLPAATASGAARLGARSLWLRDEDYSAETARNGARSGPDSARHVARTDSSYAFDNEGESDTDVD
ncbi:hypothetical protein Bbelb_203490 [Branchiostoma belcheri]|nr:hypothetical protein Bbelb_203490 [Branchiostoma belcheri]